MHIHVFLTMLALVALAIAAEAAPVDTRRGDAMSAAYFRDETEALERGCLAEVKTLADWNARRETYRQQIFEMLGLSPLPERSDLRAAVTGRVEHAQFTVEKVHFQSRPGLYVTGNLYLPKNLAKPAPAVLYVCGHSRVFKDGVAYGAKSAYQHHGGWFARHGYVCLTIDTLQLGEIEGLHHGTYREGMWWWNSRGYTPAGGEAWNCIRALDYLQARPEVDGSRLGVTGRSGGGAYSWWLAALDDRIKAAVPVAGITDLRNHVVDGAVEGHCDCMYTVNTYRWDYAQVAALVAPRPLLIANSDKDPIFPLDGVVRLHARVRRIYELHGAADKLGLLVTEGPHRDTQDLQLPAFRWFNRFLKGEDPPIETAARGFFEPEQLKVFSQLPGDQRNTRIHETFTAVAATPEVPENAETWRSRREEWLTALRERTFRGWPGAEGTPPLAVREVFSASRRGVRFSAYDFTSQGQGDGAIRLRLYLARPADGERPELVVLNLLDQPGWERWLAAMRTAFAEELGGETAVPPDERAFSELERMFQRSRWAMAYVAPRGVGPTAWNPDPRNQVQIRRRFMLLGQTLAGMQAWDARRAVQALRGLGVVKDVPVWLQGERDMAPVALYAALFEPGIARLDLWHLPRSHREGPDFLNVLRFIDLPQAVALAAERSQVELYQGSEAGWVYPRAVAARLGWGEKRVDIRIVEDAAGR